MSFWKYMFDSEWSQRRDIEHLKAANLSRTRRSSRAARSNTKSIDQLTEQVQSLEDTVGEMALYLKSVATLLEQNGVLTQESLLESMRKIDAEDGNVDGKTTL